MSLLYLGIFPDVICSPGVIRYVFHITLHQIKTISDQSLHCSARQLVPDHLQIPRSEFEEMIRDSITRRSESSWASPLYLVPKNCSTLSTFHGY